MVFEDELSKPAVATMAECSISTTDLLSYVLDGLFASFGEETILDDDDVWNYDDVGELCNETDCDSESIFYRFSSANDDESYSMKPEDEHRTVLAM